MDDSRRQILRPVRFKEFQLGLHQRGEAGFDLVGAVPRLLEQRATAGEGEIVGARHLEPIDGEVPPRESDYEREAMLRAAAPRPHALEEADETRRSAAQG